MKSKVLLVLLFSCAAHGAVHLNPDGLGQVLLYPYYTVNNNLNTVYTVTNTTAETKAIKIRFIEGLNGLVVLDFNVYLDGYDSWQGVLSPVTASLPNHAGEPSASHSSPDHSCAPFLRADGQEFLPYMIDTDPPNNTMQRAREGHIEVIELATFAQGSITQQFADHANSDTPNNCVAIQADWDDNNVYDTGDERPPSGGLTGHSSLIDPENGLTMDYRAIAVGGFWPANTVMHTTPGYFLPNLNAGDHTSSVIINEVVHQASWQAGFAAVSAVLQSAQIINEYDLDPVTNSLTEWVVTFPTKHHHTNGVLNAVPPFDDLWDGEQSCNRFRILNADQDQKALILFDSGLCFHTNVMQVLSSTPASQTSALLGSKVNTRLPARHEGAGWITLIFDQPIQRMIPVTGQPITGLPAIGFQVRQFTNNQAQPGMVAQYTQLTPHSHQRQIDSNPQ